MQITNLNGEVCCILVDARDFDLLWSAVYVANTCCVNDVREAETDEPFTRAEIDCLLEDFELAADECL